MNQVNLDNGRRYGVEVEFVSKLIRSQMADKIQDETGVEMHCVSYSNKSNIWRLKYDGSVDGSSEYCHGMELVTPILHGEDDMLKLKRVVDVIESVSKVNRSCGLHVHIDVVNASTHNLRKLMKFFSKYEAAIGLLLPESRRGQNNRYCQDAYCTEKNLYEVHKELNRMKKRHLLSYSEFSGRDKWNFQNYIVHGSFENRAHSGTLDTAKIENWVRLSQGMVEAAFTFKGSTIYPDDTTRTYTSKHMLDALAKKGVITKDIKAFYKKRFMDLNTKIHNKDKAKWMWARKPSSIRADNSESMVS
tara:strand:+ start:5670 stop:6578 length:909 start_codon:yes stop_codon:yes gene_type:complete